MSRCVERLSSDRSSGSPFNTPGELLVAGVARQRSGTSAAGSRYGNPPIHLVRQFTDYLPDDIHFHHSVGLDVVQYTNKFIPGCTLGSEVVSIT